MIDQLSILTNQLIKSMPELKASEAGLKRIQQQRNTKGWTVEDSRWLVEASKILEPDRDWQPESDFYADGISAGTWKAFLYNTRKKGVTSEAFKAFCKVLEIPWAEVIESQIPSALSGASLSECNIPWHEVCLAVLEAQKQQSLTSHVLGAVGSRKVTDVYVPLGLVERKDKPRVDSNLDPSKSVMPEKETTIPISHRDFFDGVLKQGESPKSKGRRIAVIGEPGAGKTTLLQTIAATIDGIPIWIELSDLKQGQTLEDFLENHWLKRALLIIREHCPDLVPSLRTASDGLKEALAEVFGTGQVWLLLNGVDEMAASLGQPLAWVSEQLKQVWVSKAKAVISCRLNLWSASGDRLPDFDVYRNLDFNNSEVQEFITNWFAEPSEPSSGEALWGELQKSSDRIRGLVRNPLRLTLLCLSWKESGEKLPETKAGLYQRFVDAYYKWKADKPEFVLSLTDQEQLHHALGNLAKAALEQQDSRFRLRHGFIRQHLETSVFEQAVKLGWLIPIGLPTLDEEHDRDEDVYTFWHPTFQEYFSALAITKSNSWHYILPFSMNSVWHEVFLLTTDLLFDPHKFLFEFESFMHGFIVEKYPILIRLINDVFPSLQSLMRMQEFEGYTCQEAEKWLPTCRALSLGQAVRLIFKFNRILVALDRTKEEEFLEFIMVFSELTNYDFKIGDQYKLAILLEPEPVINKSPINVLNKIAGIPCSLKLEKLLQPIESPSLFDCSAPKVHLSKKQTLGVFPRPLISRGWLDFIANGDGWMQEFQNILSENDAYFDSLKPTFRRSVKALGANSSGKLVGQGDG
jgi:energy-coupling factor transporter ATP-binding protein EcfA2